MNTEEIINGLTTIRKVLDQIEVRGTDNVKALAVADEHCRILIDKIQNESKKEDSEETE